MLDFIGGRTRTRTWDPLIKSQLLYQLSYAPEKCRPTERARSCSKAGSHCPGKARSERWMILPPTRTSAKGTAPEVPRNPARRMATELACDGAGVPLHRAPPRISHPRPFHTRVVEFPKRKAAGWGPGGSRT